MVYPNSRRVNAKSRAKTDKNSGVYMFLGRRGRGVVFFWRRIPNKLYFDKKNVFALEKRIR